jgi:hypothetical protein
MTFYRIQLKRDSAADWTSNNPVLAEGEPGLELDTQKWKVGDGATAWNTLPYQAGTGTGTGNMMVAASNATANEKIYAVASGGSVCNGTNDQDNINTAAVAVGHGKLLLSSGTFNIDAALTIDDGCTIVGMGSGEEDAGTTLAITGTNYGITLQSPAASIRFISRLWGVRITTPQNFASTALKVLANRSVWNEQLILDDLNIKAYLGGHVESGAADKTAGSIGLQITANASCSLALCSFGSISIGGYEIGLNILLSGFSGTQWAYINGNHFYSTCIEYSKYLVKIHTSSSSTALVEISDNFFSMFQGQPELDSATTVYGIWLRSEGNDTYSIVRGNNFIKMMLWDWTNATSFGIFCDNETVAANTTRWNQFNGIFTMTGANGVSDNYSGSAIGLQRYWNYGSWSETAYGSNIFERQIGG